MLRWLLILLWTGGIYGDSAFLQCDEFDRPQSLEMIEDIIANLYCTITGLQVTHSQHVVLFRGDYLLSLNGIQYMKFYDSSLLYIPQIIFDEFRGLKNLDISNSKIIDITRNTFTYADELLTLDVSDNNITEITTSVFTGAKKLQRINLSHNRIHSLNEHSFNGLELLSRINLAGNRIKYLNRGLFIDNLNLEHIYLNNNEIQAIEPEVFHNLKLIRVIDLSNNKLLNIDSKIFENAFVVESIVLSRNLLRSLSLDLSSPLPTLYVEGNQLTNFYVNCSPANPEKIAPVKSSCDSIKWLYLGNNSITDIRNITTFSNLMVLDLSYNRIGKLNISTLARLKNLERLNLKQTNLSGITYGTFGRQTKLKFLDLSENNLQRLNLDVFLPYMTNLVEFYIDGNNLTEIHGKHNFAAFPSLRKIGIMRNNFNCSYLSHIMSKLYSNPVVTYNDDEDANLDDIAHIKGIACHNANSSDDRTGEKSEKFTLEDYERAIGKMKLHEQQLEQHLILMKFFIATIAVIGLCTVSYKITKLISINRNSFINSISYRTTANVNSIQTDIDL